MENNYYKAPDGKVYVRKADGFVMGNDIYLGTFIDGSEDVIDNYEIMDADTDSDSDTEQEQQA